MIGLTNKTILLGCGEIFYTVRDRRKKTDTSRRKS